MCVISKSSTFLLISANFYHYKSPRQTELSGVIPCQWFFGEPVLFTTFVLFVRFYHRSKKDEIRLSMTTDTDVDFRPSSTAGNTVSLNALDPTKPQKRKQIGFLLAPIVKEVSNFVSNLLMSFLLPRLI